NLSRKGCVPIRGTISSTLKVRGEIIFQANRYLGGFSSDGFSSSQRIFPPQTIQVLLKARAVHRRTTARSRRPTAYATLRLPGAAPPALGCLFGQRMMGGVEND